MRGLISGTASYATGRISVLVRSASTGSAAMRTLPRVVSCCEDRKCAFGKLAISDITTRRKIGG